MANIAKKVHKNAVKILWKNTCILGNSCYTSYCCGM